MQFSVVVFSHKEVGQEKLRLALISTNFPTVKKIVSSTFSLSKTFLYLLLYLHMQVLTGNIVHKFLPCPVIHTHGNLNTYL